MIITLIKRESKTSQSTRHDYTIEDYKILQRPQNMFLLKNSTLHSTENGKEKIEDTLEIFKVQFIASCKTKVASSLIIAFFIDENFEELQPYVIDSLSLPTNYYQDLSCSLVDYESYIQICEMTKETKLTFIDFCNKVVMKSNCVNSLVKHDNDYVL